MIRAKCPLSEVCATVGAWAAATATIMAVLLAGCSGPPSAGTIREVAWLDNGEFLALIVMPLESSQSLDSAVVVVAQDGTLARTVTVPGATVGELSACADGHSLLCTSRPAPIGYGTEDDEEPRGWPWMDTDVGVITKAGELELLDIHGSNHYPTCSPAGAEVAFLHSAGWPPLSDADVVDLDYGIWLFAFETRSLRQVTNLTPRWYVEFPPQWSPDGQHLALARAPDLLGDPEPLSRDIWVVDISCPSEQQLTDVGDVRPLPVVWTPDGESILFLRASGGEEAGSGPVPLSLWSVSVPQGVLRPVLSWASLLRPRSRWDLAVSPSGTRVAVKSRTADTAGMALWIIDVRSGQAAEQIAIHSQIGQLSWSKDGALLAYIVDGEELWVADVRTGERASHSRRVFSLGR